MCWQKLMVLCYPIHGTLISDANIMCKILVGINKFQCFLAYVKRSTISSSGLPTEGAL
jgi:hypothetical protein